MPIGGSRPRPRARDLTGYKAGSRIHCIMQQKQVAGAVLGVVVVVGLGLVMTGSGSGTGSLELLISDQPGAIEDFSYLNVSFAEARVFRSAANNTTAAETIDLDGTRSVDLTRVTGTTAVSLINTSLATGQYEKIELYVDTVDARANGAEVDVKVPPGKLMLTRPFTVTANSTTSFVFDIQVTLRGNAQNNQGYILRPVISQSGTAGEDVEVTRNASGSRGPPSGVPAGGR